MHFPLPLPPPLHTHTNTCMHTHTHIHAHTHTHIHTHTHTYTHTHTHNTHMHTHTPHAHTQHTHTQHTHTQAIRMHTVHGRNFLDRLRLAQEKQRTISPELTQSERRHVPRQASSPDRIDLPEKGITVSAHRQLAHTKSVPIDPSPRRQLPSLPPNAHRIIDNKETYDSPPPPIPPQRFRPVDDMSAVHMRPKRPQGGRESLRRHSSVEGFTVEDLHMQQGQRFKKGSVPDHAMNLILRKDGQWSPKDQRSPNGHRLPQDHRSPQGQKSPNGRGSPLGQRSPVGARSPIGKKSPILPPKQISLDTALDTNQKSQNPNGSPKPRRRGDYIQIQFAQESPAAPETDTSTPLPRDAKTKFPYSTVVFQKEPEKNGEKGQNLKIMEPERDVEKAQNLKKKKPPPSLPPKYDSSESSKKGMKKFVSDSHMTSESSMGMPPSKPNSLPDLINEGGYEVLGFSSTSPETPSTSDYRHIQQQNGTGDIKDDPPYVNVPRRGAPQPKPR